MFFRSPASIGFQILFATLPFLAACSAAAETAAAQAEAAAGEERPSETLTGDSNSPRALTIAVLMPTDGSPFSEAARIVSSGLAAASRTSARPARLLSIEAAKGASIQAQLDAAVAAGADVVVGPLERNAVEAVCDAGFQPLPVVALNAAPDRAETAPDNLIMLSISTEAEAAYIASLAAKALPTETFRSGKPKAAILTTGSGSAWEERIVQAYAAELNKHGVLFDVVAANIDNLAELQAKLAPTLSAEEEAAYAAEQSRIRKEYSDRKAQRQRLRNLELRRRAKIALGEPPYQAALFAMDAQSASLVRNRLPLSMRVWGISAANPGDPRTSSTSSALAYDLDNLIFAESPVVVRYDSRSFEARFETAMPHSLAAKRLFALGADAYEVAQQWSSMHQIIQHNGETGRLSLDRKASAAVARIPQTIIVKNGRLAEVDADLAARPKLPEIALPKLQDEKPLPEVQNVYSDSRRTDVREVVIDAHSEYPEPQPTPMLPPAQSAADAVPPSPAERAEASPIDAAPELDAERL